MKLQERFESINICEHMCEAAKAATAYFYGVCRKNPNIISGRLFRLRDIKNCNEDIEDTYLVRLFALFEVTLRNFLEKSLRRKSKPDVSALINRVASRQRVQEDIRQKVHTVRDYRNSLVHAGKATPMSLREARRYLNQFLANLPREW